MRQGLLYWLKNDYATKIKKKRYSTLGIWESSVDSCEKSTQHLCFHLSFLQERLEKKKREINNQLCVQTTEKNTLTAFKKRS